MNIDGGQSNIIGIDKFDIECKQLGIKLSETDLNTLLNLFEEKTHFNDYNHIPSINYNLALQSMVPVLQKNGDKMISSTIGNPSFKIGWTVSKNTKVRESVLKRQQKI